MSAAVWSDTVTRGRKPLPTVVKELNGNPGKRPLNKSEPKPDGALKTPPTSLTPDQVIIWKNTLKIAPAGLLTAVDSSVVERFCMSLDGLRKANLALAKRGSQTITEDGKEKIAPEVHIISKMDAVLRGCTAAMGFDPSSRSRLHLEDPRDPSNPFENL